MAESPEAVRAREEKFKMYTAIKEGLRVIDEVKSNTHSVQLPPRVRDDWLNFENTDGAGGGEGVYAMAGQPGGGYGFGASQNTAMATPRQRTSRLQAPISPAPAAPGPVYNNSGSSGARQPPSRPPPPSRPDQPPPPQVRNSSSTYQMLTGSYEIFVLAFLS